MQKLAIRKVAIRLLICAAPVCSVQANEVEIVGADFVQGRDGTWSVNVGLLHADNGWDHYADIWRLVDAEGNILGERVLLHPHEDEQPFIRGTEGIVISEGAKTLYIEAHDMVHGWTPNRLEVDMAKVSGGRLRVMPQN